MTVKDAQVSRLMDEMTKHGRVGLAAMRSGMDRKTARKYLEAKKLPSEMKEPRSWKTRKDPFEADWSWVVGQLETSPELEAKTLFEALQREHPGGYEDGQLRTLQRRLKQWRAEHGPDKEVFFAQEHRPGEALQLDFTHGTKLDATQLERGHHLFAGENVPRRSATRRQRPGRPVRGAHRHGPEPRAQPTGAATALVAHTRVGALAGLGRDRARLLCRLAGDVIAHPQSNICSPEPPSGAAPHSPSRAARSCRRIFRSRTSSPASSSSSFQRSGSASE